MSGGDQVVERSTRAGAWCAVRQCRLRVGARAAFVAYVCETMEAAALLVVRLALELGEPAGAKGGDRWLRAFPGSEPTYRAGMEIEHAVGNADGVNNALRELSCVLAGAVDDGFACEPSAESSVMRDPLNGEAGFVGPLPGTVDEDPRAANACATTCSGGTDRGASAHRSQLTVFRRLTSQRRRNYAVPYHSIPCH